MKAGISSYTFTWAIGVPGKEPEHKMTAYDLIDKAKEFGVGLLQIADNLPLDQFSEIELEQIKKYAEDSGIQIEVGARCMTPENLKIYIDLSAFFGSPILRFVIDGPGFEPGIEEVHRTIAEVVPLLEEKKIILAIENHDRFKSFEFAEMVKVSGSEWIGICLDSVNSMGAGEGLETVMDALAPLTVNLHVKEFSIERVSHKMGFVVTGCPLGKGMLPVNELIQRIPEKCRSAILEQWTPPEKTISVTIQKEAEWALQSINYLKSIL